MVGSLVEGMRCNAGDIAMPCPGTGFAARGWDGTVVCSGPGGAARPVGGMPGALMPMVLLRLARRRRAAKPVCERLVARRRRAPLCHPQLTPVKHSIFNLHHGHQRQLSLGSERRACVPLAPTSTSEDPVVQSSPPPTPLVTRGLLPHHACTDQGLGSCLTTNALRAQDPHRVGDTLFPPPAPPIRRLPAWPVPRGVGWVTGEHNWQTAKPQPVSSVGGQNGEASKAGAERRQARVGWAQVYSL